MLNVDANVKCEHTLKDEARTLVEEFSRKRGQAFDPQQDITVTVSNIICSIAFGTR